MRSPSSRFIKAVSAKAARLYIYILCAEFDEGNWKLPMRHLSSLVRNSESSSCRRQASPVQDSFVSGLLGLGAVTVYIRIWVYTVPFFLREHTVMASILHKVDALHRVWSAQRMLHHQLYVHNKLGLLGLSAHFSEKRDTIVYSCLNL